ncbi:MAG: lytic transglycosylase domain-containing protein [Saprospiraceae bacterium]|nr:lytic transglycosylase domain-containing protein [Saprospiraceae bacterium]
MSCNLKWISLRDAVRVSSISSGNNYRAEGAKPFVESRLKINAESPAGAKGLWQFMDYTARQYKLQINEYVDERLDLMRSTDAAARLLVDLHKQFDDWLLVLAAYNCGPGKVRKAIRRADCNNYWEIEQYLPRQTQGYILSFISAAYVVAYSERHGLKVNPHAVEELSVLKIRDSIHLQGVAQAANLSLHTMRRLNPGYQQEVIPASRRGNYLILRADSLPSVQAMLRKQKVAFNFIPFWNQEKPTKAIAYTLPSLKPLLSAPLDWRFPFHFQHQYTQNNMELFLNPLKFFSQMA